MFWPSKFQTLNIHNKLQHKTRETVDEIGMPKFSPKFDH